MKLEERVNAIAELGERLSGLADAELDIWTANAYRRNSWFTPEYVKLALEGIVLMLEQESLKKWVGTYQIQTEVPKIVGIVMAGNIPLVGFHDLLCVLISGHYAAIKTSSQDEYLVKELVKLLFEIEPKFKRNLDFPEQLKVMDAVIATGSDNSARYFQHYFGKYPHIIRKNRTSVAVLDGSESDDQLHLLGSDVFQYFGLGCRNVSKVYTPENYDIPRLLDVWQSFSPILEHHKYKNNYDYHKSIYLVNREPHLDTGFSLWYETSELVSPISITYHQRYHNLDEVKDILRQNEEKIQCVISAINLPGALDFGQAQRPAIWDYADNVDTMEFLGQL
ncbi:MAG: acyl-CoA reductase [Cyclobacteriaceae bacterium]|nr:acyl-CoA reductase [Cyclobacteriaceae bacterium HetDA_MAG_MS6]